MPGIPSGTFATAINCIDGRVQDTVSDWIKTHQGVRYVDMITEAGADMTLLRGAAEDVASIRRKVMISLEKHHSRTIAIVGHHDCAGNPVSKEQHLQDIRDSVDALVTWNLPVRLLGLWVNEFGWIEVVCDSEAAS